MRFERPISQVMSTRLVTVEPDTRLTKIRQIFETNPFHHIPVIDHGRVVGIISKSDFYRVSHTLSFTWDGAEHMDQNHHIFSAKDLMTKYPMCLEPDDTVSLAADIFLANKFHALPVVDDETLVGIVTSHDLIATAFGSPIPEDAPIEDFQDI